ncbi:helix-turn-helix domain-containing protein [Dokdonella sp.]|uniref:helix-turn-helix domain-containing protein n=1 Tax=Dokdonella sp. TaxID=2291710 RepID=UPI0031C79FF4|nr:helix-turn-helix transcriptional regulator [Dokdonella sp.]
MGKTSFQALMRQAGMSSALAVEGAKLDFALELAKLLDRAGMSRSDLAASMGVSLPMVTKILRGDANLTIETMVKATRAAQGRLHINLAPEASQCRWFEVVSSERQRTQCLPAVQPRVSRGAVRSWNLVSGDETQPVAA